MNNSLLVYLYLLVKVSMISKFLQCIYSPLQQHVDKCQILLLVQMTPGPLAPCLWMPCSLMMINKTDPGRISRRLWGYVPWSIFLKECSSRTFNGSNLTLFFVPSVLVGCSCSSSLLLLIFSLWLKIGNSILSQPECFPVWKSSLSSKIV